MKTAEIFPSLDFDETGDWWLTELPIGCPIGPFPSFYDAAVAAENLGLEI
jgi:hypothetical protein